MRKPIALITGVNGQDGSYLSESLLQAGYEVHGLIRRASTFNRARIDHLRPEARTRDGSLHLHYGDVTDSSSLRRVLKDVSPDEVYHLAAQSHVGISFEVPDYTADSIALGTLRLLDAIRAEGMADHVRFYNAATSELFGGQGTQEFSEESEFYPRSPYAVAKLYSYWIAKNYREAFGMYVSNGILFNHESPRRGENFVTKKISQSLTGIASGRRQRLVLGNLDAARDWGYAPDYVRAMHVMLQSPRPSDYVVATGKVHTVRQFVDKSCAILGIDLRWRGSGVEEVGVDSSSGEVRVEVSPHYFRPTEVDWLCGDASKIKRDLGWEPDVDFDRLVEIMIRSDVSGVEVRPEDLD
jgi:GDPmannose 4,6-dehydratase